MNNIFSERESMETKLLLFDLDGTLLQTDKTISKFTMQELEKCRNQGIMIGVSTSRSEKNSMEFIAKLNNKNSFLENLAVITLLSNIPIEDNTTLKV